MATARPRAFRITAPGAVRVTLNGILATSDDHGRLRLLLLDEGRDGAPDGSWAKLREAVPREAVPHLHAACEAHTGPLAPNSDGVRATALIVLPAHRRAHWQRVATDLRGRWVTAEVTARPSRMPGGAGPQGISLDLAMLTPQQPN
jgi:hypothetical protein